MTMKRVTATFLAAEALEKSDFVKQRLIVELEKWEEKLIAKEKNVIEEHGFDSLLEGGLEFIQGIFLVFKGFGKMAMFAIVIVVEGVKYLWKHGAGQEKSVKK
jgi:hypothetical protein